MGIDLEKGLLTKFTVQLNVMLNIFAIFIVKCDVINEIESKSKKK